MESTFKREYDKEQLADGSLRLLFKESRVGAHQGSQMSRLIMFFLLVAGVALTSLTTLISSVIGEKNTFVAFAISVAAVGYGVVKMGRKMFFKRSSILVRLDGIIFEKQGATIFNAGTHQLAFRDIASFGISTETASGTGKYTETSYLYANAGGQQIRITKHMSHALAQALWDEIQAVPARSSVVA